ncbi:MAG: crotonase/enoyl-CoA hydratase family protein [Pseudomonadota bacterium]
MTATEYEIDDRGVATLWLSRPEVHNALNAQMMDEITARVSGFRTGDAPRVLILAGRGRSFCAGGDLGWMRAQFDATPAARDTEARRIAGMLQALHMCDVPIIGRIHGNALGGGVGMACVCDAAIGVLGRKLGLTETRLGLIPATIGPYVAARMGTRTREVFMSSRIFEAEEAVRLGILSQAVPEDDLDAAVEAAVLPYLSCAPGAVAEAKQLARALGPRIDADTIDLTVAALAARWESAEAQEGIAAFFDKRPAPWMLS